MRPREERKTSLGIEFFLIWGREAAAAPTEMKRGMPCKRLLLSSYSVLPTVLYCATYCTVLCCCIVQYARRLQARRLQERAKRSLFFHLHRSTNKHRCCVVCVKINGRIHCTVRSRPEEKRRRTPPPSLACCLLFNLSASLVVVVVNESIITHTFEGCGLNSYNNNTN